MTHHLHIGLKSLGLSFFLDVQTLDDLKNTLLTLNKLPNIPAQVTPSLIIDATSVEDLLEDYQRNYTKNYLQGAFLQFIGPFHRDDIITITYLEDEDDDPDIPTRELPPYLEALWFYSQVLDAEPHPLLLTPDPKVLTTLVQGLQERQQQSPHLSISSALYGAYYSQLRSQVQASLQTSSDSQPTSTSILVLKLQPFSHLDQALAANGIMVEA